MKTLYKIELMIIMIGILAVGLSLYKGPILTGYVLGVNNTIYIEDLNLTVDSSQRYTLTSLSSNLNLKSFMASGEVIGDGRAEIILDNGKGVQYLIYENIVQDMEKTESTGFPITGIAGITGRAVDSEDNIEEKRGEWLVVQPKKAINYEFFPLKDNEKLISGEFYSECKETCMIPDGLFNSDSYEIIFRLEAGTTVKLTSIRYTLHE